MTEQSFAAGSDDDAVAGESAGYVPCDELPSDLPATNDDSQAMAGGETGFVADGEFANPEDAADDADPIEGREVGFVAKPCEVTCTGTLTIFDRDAATSWRPYFLVSFFVREGQVADGSPPSGSVTELPTQGPRWEAFPADYFPPLQGGRGGSWLHDGFSGDPWLLQEGTDTWHLSWDASAFTTYPLVRIQGTIRVTLSWIGTGTDEAAAINPEVTWELCLADYGALNVATSAFNEPVVGTYDDLYLTDGVTYTPDVVATGTNGLGTSPLDVTIANPGTNYLQLFLRITPESSTVTVFDRPFEDPPLVAEIMPPFPGYIPTTYETGFGGMAVVVDDLTLSFCQ